MYTDDDGVEFFASGESMEMAFDNLYHVYQDTGDTGPGMDLDLDPDDGGILFFERIAVQYVTRPRFERV
jgi:hypothetical protein